MEIHSRTTRIWGLLSLRQKEPHVSEGEVGPMCHFGDNLLELGQVAFAVEDGVVFFVVELVVAGSHAYHRRFNKLSLFAMMNPDLSPCSLRYKALVAM